MDEKMTLNVGGQTIISRKLFNMKDYYDLKNRGVLDEYLKNLTVSANNPEFGAFTVFIKTLMFILLTFIAVIVYIMSDMLVMENIPSAFDMAIAMGIVIVTLVLVKGLYNLLEYDKENCEEYKDAVADVKELESQYPLLVTLKEHAEKVSYEGYELKIFTNLLNFIESVPTKDEKVNVFFYRDPNDKEMKRYHFMLMFSTKETNTYVRYAFEYLGDDSIYDKDNDLGITSIGVAKLEVGGSSKSVKETFNEDDKFLELLSDKVVIH